MTSVHLTQDGVAFSAYVSAHETELSKGYTIHFDTIITNIGSHYNKYSGVFKAPQDGIYVFAWTLYCHAEGYIFSELVVNSDVVGAMVSDGELQGATNIQPRGSWWWRSVRGTPCMYVLTPRKTTDTTCTVTPPGARLSMDGESDSLTG